MLGNVLRSGKEIFSFLKEEMLKKLGVKKVAAYAGNFGIRFAVMFKGGTQDLSDPHSLAKSEIVPLSRGLRGF